MLAVRARTMADSMECNLDRHRAPGDVVDLRRAMGCFATGVAIVTTKTQDGKLVGLTANSFSSVSLDPPLILWSLRNEAPSFSSFSRSNWFAVNVLAAHQHHLARRFATPAADKFHGIDFFQGASGCPLLPECVAHFECSVETMMAGGDHTIFVGRLQHVFHRDSPPLIFSSGKFCMPTKLP